MNELLKNIFIKNVDKTMLLIISAMITFFGALFTFIKYSPPELCMSFWGSNPFTIKANIINTMRTKVFFTFTIIGIVMQFTTAMYGDCLTKKLYGYKFYILYTVCIIISVVLLAGIVNTVSKVFAKRKWLPKIVEIHKEMFYSSKFIIDHDELREDQIKNIDKLENIDNFRKSNFRTAEGRISQIENILEVNNNEKNLTSRVNNLKKYFRES